MVFLYRNSWFQNGVSRVRTESWVLEKVLKFADREKVWKTEIKFGKMVKSLGFFFPKLQQVLYKWIFCRFGQILSNLARMFAAHREKDFVPTFSKVSTDHLVDNLESEKRNYCFAKKICTNPVTHFVLVICINNSAVVWGGAGGSAPPAAQ